MDREEGKWIPSYHVLPNYKMQMLVSSTFFFVFSFFCPCSFFLFYHRQGHTGVGADTGDDMGLTFSRPKNLSVPSFRKGPAFCSIFSRGVSSGAGSSFFLPATSLGPGVTVP